MTQVRKAIPKEVMPVVGRPLIQHVVAETPAAGPHEIAEMTRAGTSAMEDRFDLTLGPARPGADHV